MYQIELLTANACCLGNKKNANTGAGNGGILTVEEKLIKYGK